MMDDLTPEKDGVLNINMEDDVIRGATAAKAGEITFPPPPPKVAAIAAAKPKAPEPTAEELKAAELAAFKTQTRNQVGMLAIGGALLLLIGLVAPASFMQHFIVFVLAVFVGFQVIWNVSHALHTPLMAITNAISSIILWRVPRHTAHACHVPEVLKRGRDHGFWIYNCCVCRFGYSLYSQPWWFV